MMRLLILVISLLLAGSAMSADWVDVTPGEDLKGWTRTAIPGVSVVKPYNQWSSDGSIVICKGDGSREWLRYDEQLSDFEMQVEWRATARDGSYNSGVGVRMSPQVEIWHQAQTKPEGGYLFGNTFKDGKLERISVRDQMTENRVKPAGEWNKYEIRCEGGTIALSVNGALVNTWSDVEVRSGHIGLEAEGYRSEFRKVRVKRLD
jgi:hypothetical protein